MRRIDVPCVEQFTNVVAEGDALDADDGPPFARQPDAAKLEPSQERSFEPSDVELGGQVLIGLPHDQIPQPILAPARLKGREADSEKNQDEGNHEDKAS